MALSPDDRLLGEKTHYYCSSSEDEDEEEDETKYGDEKGKGAEKGPDPNIAPPEIGDYKGYATNVSQTHDQPWKPAWEPELISVDIWLSIWVVSV